MRSDEGLQLRGSKAKTDMSNSVGSQDGTDDRLRDGEGKSVELQGACTTTLPGGEARPKPGTMAGRTVAGTTVESWNDGPDATRSEASTAAKGISLLETAPGVYLALHQETLAVVNTSAMFGTSHALSRMLELGRNRFVLELVAVVRRRGGTHGRQTVTGVNGPCQYDEWAVHSVQNTQAREDIDDGE